MAKKQFKIRTTLQFKGEFYVRAHNRQEAEEIIKANCGALLGKVESNHEYVEDWEFPTHGEIVINRKREGEEVEQC